MFCQKKNCSFYQEVVFSKISSIEFKGKLLKQWLLIVCTFMVDFVEAVRADF